MVSSTWLAKNMIAVSMMANNNAKKTGATSANSTAADPRRLPRNRRRAVLSVNLEGTGDGIASNSPAAAIICPDQYRKLIV